MLSAMMINSMIVKGLVFSFYFQSTVISQAKNIENHALLGEWRCGPYTMTGEGFEVTVTEAVVYRIDGSYESTSDLTLRLESGRVVRTKDRAFGSWGIDEGIIEVRYSKVKFLWSDDPTYTIEMGQHDADAQLRAKSWSKAKIVRLDEKLITTTVEPMYEGAKTTVMCVRPK